MQVTGIDITHIPFSRYGAYLAITRDEGKNGEGNSKELVIQCARRRFEESPLFLLTFGTEEPEDFVCSAVPEVLTVENRKGCARIYVRDDDTIVIDSRGLDFRLNQIHWGYGTETGERTFRLISGVHSLFSSIIVPTGRAVLEGPADNMGRDRKTNLSVTCENGRILMAVAVLPRGPKEIPLPIRPEEEIAAVRGEWEAFLALMPTETGSDPETAEFARLTWYNLWSCFVRAD
ncbi:MAG: hypothetical protein IKZ41_07665, partial [Clostridia bacterium]|nr:hypothetical protein [Clostridia bacterium]